jgi:hypothetical protein
MEELRKRGAEPIVIGNGPVQFAAQFKKDIGFEAELYTDPSRETYRAAELKRGIASAAGLGSIAAGIKALSQGFMQTRTRGDALQLGGVLIIDREGRLLYRQASKYAGDHAPLEELLQAVAR